MRALPDAPGFTSDDDLQLFLLVEVQLFSTNVSGTRLSACRVIGGTGVQSTRCDV